MSGDLNLSTGNTHGPNTVDGVRDMIYAALCGEVVAGSVAPDDAFSFVEIDDSQHESKLGLVNSVNGEVWLVSVRKAHIAADHITPVLPKFGGGTLQQQAVPQ